MHASCSGYLSQPFHVVSAHTGIKGVSVPLSATLDDCESFLLGKFEDVSEDQCYMRGSIKGSEP